MIALVLAILVQAASGSGASVSPRSPQSEAPHVGGSLHPGNGKQSRPSSEDPSSTLPTTGGASFLLAGKATHYCLPGQRGTSYCTRGYGPDDMVAAIDRKDTPWRKGDRVLVTHGSRSVVVTIVDVCGCPGTRLIDLTSGAFRRLAPLSRGVIPVELADAASIRPPQTDTAP